MAQQNQSYGKALPDQVDRIASLFDAHLLLVSDVREIYRDRVALEREYAAKLQALARRAADKKIKMEASFVVGEDPTKTWNESTLKQSTLNVAYNELMSSIVSTAQDHISVADGLSTQVVDVLKLVEKKNDELKKKELQFFQKLLSDRDRVYTERVKTKQKYDDECSEVESIRQKQGRATDDRHADRAAKQAEQQRNDMMNSKNLYLIATAVANKTKAKFYDEDLPGLEDQFQEHQKRLTERFTQVLLHSQALQLKHLDSLKGRLTAVESALNDINPIQDQDLFIDHNVRAFTAPGDWAFEPCSIHYDTGEMSVEPAPKIFLQNKLSRSRSKLQELDPVLASKRKELGQLTNVVAARNSDRSLGDADEVIDDYIETRQQLVFFSNSECILNTEIDVISSVLGGDEGGQQPHSFKSSSFSIPTQCGYCKSSIWGLSKQGKTCKLCGLSVHNKCELKIPADCQQSAGPPTHSSLSSRASTTSRKSSIQSQSSGSSIPTPSSFVHAPHEEVAEGSYPLAKVLFDFVATSEFELGVTEGSTVHIVESDDGSGWVKVADSSGRDGLVPATYIELSDEHHSGSSSPSRQASSQHVRALYDYQATGPDEISLKEGEMVDLTSGPSGGQNYGDGWWEGMSAKGHKGIFPSNYVQLVP
ncbi:hypothetical protein HGRIS_006332 [Hohenbuehelia grisea]|uniref:Uncharacterized protein n=1 Tax=Hohenbuehelia grisea TaxID=104357 RepID=A0ABR3K2E4_9AGAR